MMSAQAKELPFALGIKLIAAKIIAVTQTLEQTTITVSTFLFVWPISNSHLSNFYFVSLQIAGVESRTCDNSVPTPLVPLPQDHMFIGITAST